MSLLCRLGIHARIRVPEPGKNLFQQDLQRCRRCPAQWRVGSYGYSWGVVHYKHRIADRVDA